MAGRWWLSRSDSSVSTSPRRFQKCASHESRDNRSKEGFSPSEKGKRSLRHGSETRKRVKSEKVRSKRRATIRNCLWYTRTSYKEAKKALAGGTQVYSVLLDERLTIRHEASQSRLRRMDASRGTENDLDATGLVYGRDRLLFSTACLLADGKTDPHL